MTIELILELLAKIPVEVWNFAFFFGSMYSIVRSYLACKSIVIDIKQILRVERIDD